MNESTVKLIECENGISIVNSNLFLVLSNFTHSNPFDIVKNVTIVKNFEKDDIKSGIVQESDFSDYFVKEYDDVSIFTFIENNIYIQNFTDDLKVANSYNGFNNAKINLNNVVYINRSLSHNDLIKIYSIVTRVKARYLAKLYLPVHIQNILNQNDFFAILVNYSNDKNDEFNFDKLEEIIEISIDDAFKRLNLNFGILDYLVSEGILIGDLIDAGVEIIPDCDNDDFRKNLESQILKSLSDVNVISILMAAMRLDDDLISKRIRELNNSDLYGDDVLGLTISNQIAGTKGIFNFKLYNELKPGIIYGLPPVFAGFIAGCVSKISGD